MIYRLRYGQQFQRQLKSLPGHVRSAARRLLESLTAEPRPPQAKELDNHPNHYRIWLLGDHRLVYQVMEEQQIIYLLYIGPKIPDLYARLGLGRN